MPRDAVLKCGLVLLDAVVGNMLVGLGKLEWQLPSSVNVVDATPIRASVSLN